MNRSRIRLAGRLVRLRGRKEQIDRLALAGARAAQAELAGGLERLGEALRRQDRQVRAILQGAQAAGRPGLLAMYRRQVAESGEHRTRLRGRLGEIGPELGRRAEALTESMAHRKAAQALLGRLMAQQALRTAARQSREQEDLRAAARAGHGG
jgi:hypothetical protein